MKSFKKINKVVFIYFISQYVENDHAREWSGRKWRVDPFKESHGYGLPEFEIFLTWLKSSCLTPVPVKTVQHLLEDPRELAVIQERVATLSSEDEETLRVHIRWMSFQRLGRRVLLSNSVETPSKVRAGVSETTVCSVCSGGIERKGDSCRDTWCHGSRGEV